MLRLATVVTVGLLLVSATGLPTNGRPQSDKLTDGVQEVGGGTEEKPTCGYLSCPKTDANKINVHMVPHTHDDVGWVKTVDQYFYGTRKAFNRVGVENILDSVIPQLVMDKTKRFIYVEMSFFKKWWDERDESVRSTVKQLVDEGRLEFINGGWCMNDEATVTYHSTIEQMTLGLKFLDETFGECAHPKVGWQIDPFGHSSEQASLFAQFGFDGMYFARIGYADKWKRTNQKSLDLIWHGDRALPDQSGSIFTNVFRDHYDLSIFCLDDLCQDDNFVDNEHSYEYNIDVKGKTMIDYLRGYAKSKLTNNILIPFGGDFHFSAASRNFNSMDRLMKYIRANANDINVFYSTPTCYQLAVRNTLKENQNMKLPEKYDDFMPYDSNPTVWWSGYFSSRPSIKLIERQTAQMLQILRLISLANLIRRSRAGHPKIDWVAEVKAHEAECLMPLWEILGDLQHHDAVSGTEKQHVTNDYERRASDAVRRCAKMVSKIKRERIEVQLKRSPKFEQLKAAAAKIQLDPLYLEDTMFCKSLNISQCEALESDVDVMRYTHLKFVKSHLASHNHPSNLSHSVPQKTIPLPKELETKSVLVTIYNSLARPMNQVDVRLPCNGKCDLSKVKVVHLATNETLKLVRLALPAGVGELPYRQSRTKNEFLFYADVPALGSSSFVVGDENSDELVDEESSDDSLVITDESLTQNAQNVVRGRRTERASSEDESDDSRYQYFTMPLESGEQTPKRTRSYRRTRDAGSLSSQQGSSDRVVLKFDMKTGMITGLRRASDGSTLKLSQKFGYYTPAGSGHPSGAYIFRPDSSEPKFFNAPTSFKMYKRLNGGLIEIHQKWTDWIHQTIRLDSKKNYIEFDYVVGPIPVNGQAGREVVTRYSTNMANDKVFMTDSNARQLIPRRRLDSDDATQTGGSFFPVTSTIMIRNNKASLSNVSTEAVAILVDRSQAGTSLNEGDLELLIHRRMMYDDWLGVDEALNEPGEDGQGLVTRGRHRLFLKFKDQLGGQDPKQESSKAKSPDQPILLELPRTPNRNLTYERYYAHNKINDSSIRLEDLDDSELKPTYLIYDQLYNDIRQESLKYSLKPFMTFDRLRVPASEFLELLHANKNPPKTDESLLNTSLPNNVHLLTLQPWNQGANQLLLRFENLDNPVTAHPTPDITTYESILKSYEPLAAKIDKSQIYDSCNTRSVREVEFDVRNLLKDIKIISLSELNLGANAKLSDDDRINWTGERDNSCKSRSTTGSTIKLGPRQIKTFLATFENL